MTYLAFLFRILFAIVFLTASITKSRDAALLQKQSSTLESQKAWHQ